MEPSRAIINPVRQRHAPALGPRLLMVASNTDFKTYCRQAQLPDQRALYMSRLCFDQSKPETPAVVGPLLGAPYTTLILEQLIAWGVRKVIFAGWCGSIDPEARTGQLLVPVDAWSDEGTSVHYGHCQAEPAHPNDSLIRRLCRYLDSNRVDYRKAGVWTTDAVFRETREKVAHFQHKGASAVEMELAALFSVARFRNIELAALLLVSDELFTLKWQPGFKSPDFKQGRQQMVELLMQMGTVL